LVTRENWFLSPKQISTHRRASGKIPKSADSGHLLEGLRILDLSRVMSGPFASMLLADYGAEVIKIEDTDKGDETRNWFPPTIEGESAYFLSANRNKRDIALNLKTKEGLEIFYRLVAGADVILENFRPGVAKKLGIDYDAIAKVKPSIVYCSISGFGQSGPYRDFPGYDLIVFAMGGLMSFTGEPGGPPVRLSVPIADMSAGLYAASAILAALRFRDRTGKGQYIDVSMYDTLVSLLTHQAMSYFATGLNPGRLGSSHSNLAPYQAFAGSDGEYFVVAIGNDSLWTDFVRAIATPELALDPRFKTNPDRVRNKKVLVDRLNEIFGQKPAVNWIKVAREAGIPVGPISKVSEVLSDPQVAFRKMVTEIDNPRTGKKLPLLGTPVKFSKGKTSIRLPPPAQGENTEEILKEIGVSQKKIRMLEEKGIVRAFRKKPAIENNN
jgi:crotonobetainyl-CoA:carnitine CoA-transferase CaiB-like acyl-CoA transferase